MVVEEIMANENEINSPEDQALADEWAAALEETGDAGQATSMHCSVATWQQQPRLPMEEFGSSPKPNETSASKAEPGRDPGHPGVISMEVGSTEINIRNLLQLNQGSVIELDRLAGEPLDVLVNGTLIAHGEVVVVNEKFGIRLTDVISPSERIKKLR
jgi:flagellar motor switch protein FliN/FliY